jgi:hypothetical protein
MRKLVIVLLAVLGMSCIASAEDAVTAAPAAEASSSRNSVVVMAGLNALPSAPMPVSSPTSTLSATNSMASPGAFAPIVAIAPATRVASPAVGADKHPFLDKANLAIFASLVAARTMDPISTWQFRRHGLHEAELSDAFVDNKPLFSTYSASLVAGQISASYMFHRMGWHKVERISAIIHTGVVTEAVVHNYRIGTKH